MNANLSGPSLFTYALKKKRCFFFMMCHILYKYSVPIIVQVPLNYLNNSYIHFIARDLFSEKTNDPHYQHSYSHVDLEIKVCIGP